LMDTSDELPPAACLSPLYHAKNMSAFFLGQ
jgi:hypothetical protein